MRGLADRCLCLSYRWDYEVSVEVFVEDEIPLFSYLFCHGSTSNLRVKHIHCLIYFSVISTSSHNLWNTNIKRGSLKDSTWARLFSSKQFHIDLVVVKVSPVLLLFVHHTILLNVILLFLNWPWITLAALFLLLKFILLFHIFYSFEKWCLIKYCDNFIISDKFVDKFILSNF